MMKNNEHLLGNDRVAFINKWQNMADLLVNYFCAQAVIITQKEHGQCKLLISSRAKYGADDHAVEIIGGNRYCESVIKKLQRCLANKVQTITNQSDSLAFGPEIVTYLGYPIKFPDHRVFGTICVFDNKENHLLLKQEQMLSQIRDILESDLALNTNQKQLLIGEKGRQETIDHFKKALDEIPSGASETTLKLGKKRFRFKNQKNFKNRAHCDSLATALALERKKFEIISENLETGLIICDPNGEFIKMNKIALKFHGFSSTQDMYPRIHEYTDKWELRDLEGQVIPFSEWPIIRALRGELIREFEYQLKNLTNGETKVCRQTIIVLHDEHDKIVNYMVLFNDITLFKQVENALYARKANIEAAFANMTEAVFITNAAGEIVECNDAWITFTRFKDRTEFIKKTEKYPHLFEVSYLNGEVVPFDSWAVSRALKGETVKNAEYVIRRKDTNQIWIGSYNYSPIRDKSGLIVGSVIVCSDITERKKAEEKIINLSYRDNLTGLYNRRFYEQELIRLDQEYNLPITLVMGDINGLKLINDSFGHVMGDVLLKKTAEVIEKGCRPTDIIARMGGDEFMIILPKTDFATAEKIVKGIKRLAATERIGSFEISISFGYSTKDNKNDDMQKVFKQAEDQMYRNKLSESMRMRRRTIDIIMKTLFEKSGQEMLHSKRVSESCGEIGALLNLSEDDLKQLKIAGLMHDIGKMGIDEEILNKKQPLNDEEWNEIKRHSEVGYRILSSVNEFSKIAKQVLEHHERWDGKGYPNGLKAEEISLQARIIALSDAYDAMMSERHFRNAKSEKEAMNELIKERGAQFDPDLVDLFLKEIIKQGDGDQ